MSSSAPHPSLCALSGSLLRRILLLWLFAGSAMAATGIECRSDGIGGTGTPVMRSGEDGIGGTGDLLQRSGEDGIGGTGLAPCDGIGGTGIIGIVTGFGSIWVNGIEVHFDDSTPVSRDQAQASAADLAIGQLVAVDAGTVNGRMQAMQIAVLHAVSGQVDAVDAEHLRLSVLGQTIELAPSARAQGLPRVGDAIRVSGLRRADGTIEATLIEAAPVPAEESLLGTVQLSGPDHRAMLHGVMLLGLDSGQSALPVLLRGAFDKGRLYVSTQHQPMKNLLGQVERLSLAGYVQQQGTQGFVVNGLPVSNERLQTVGIAPAGPAIGNYVRLEAAVETGGRLEAISIEVFDSLPKIELSTLRPRHFIHNPERGERGNRGYRDIDTGRFGGAAREHGTLELERPEIEGLEYEAPEIEGFEFERPEFELPEFERPEFELPEFERPEFELPEFERPEFELPEFERPEFELPEFERR